MEEASREQILTCVKSCLTSGDYSDLTITCGSDTYHVHKMIVCTRAGFFARAVKFGGKEAQEGKIDLPDDEPEIVALLVQYLYEGEYDPRLPNSQDPAHATASGIIINRTETYSSTYKCQYWYDFPHSCSHPNGDCEKFVLCPHHICSLNCFFNCREFVCNKCTSQAVDGSADQLLTHAKMYEIADKYDVVGLKDLCKEKFSQSCGTFWNDKAFAVAANHAFSTTMEDDKGLRDVVIDVIVKHIELIRKAEIQALMADFSGLSLGILLKKADELGWGVDSKK